MTSKGNILKDSFYKQRLARTSNHIIKGYTTNFAAPAVEEESDTDAIVISPEEEQLDFKQHLADFGRTACGSTFAFRELACTHKRLPALHVPPSLASESASTSSWRRWTFPSTACAR